MNNLLEQEQGNPTHLILPFVLALGFFEGAIYNFLPITFPAFAHQFGLTLEQLGRVPLVFFLSTIVFSFGGGWLIARLGLRRAAVAILGLLIVAFVIIACMTSFLMLLVGACLFGLAVVGMEVLSASIITDVLGDKRQSNFFIWAVANALGAVIGPAVLGAFIKHSMSGAWIWRSAYLGSAAVATLFLLWPLLLRSRWQSSMASHEESVTAAGALMVVLRRPVIYALGFTIFLHGVAQIGMISWVGQVYLARFPIDPEQAAYFISFNSAGYFIGRSLMIWLTRHWKISELTLLACCAGMGSLAYVATIAAPTYGSGLLLFAVAGMFISGNGPCINSYTGLRFPGATATAFAVMNGYGNIGSATGPYFVGLIGNRFGLEHGIWLLPAFSATLAAFALVWRISDKRREDPGHASSLVSASVQFPSKSE